MGRQLHQAFQGVGGPSLRTGLQHFSHCNQRQNHGRRLKIKFVHIRHNTRRILPQLGIRHGKQRVGAVHEGSSRSQRHQRIHVGRSMEQALESADEKLLVNHHDNHCQKQLHKSHGHMVLSQKFRQRPVPHHMSHGYIHQRNQETKGSDQSFFENGRLPVLQHILPSGCRICFLLSGCLRFRRSSVSCFFHCRYDSFRAGVSLHTHGIGQKTHRTGCHPRVLWRRPSPPGRCRQRSSCLSHYIAPYLYLLRFISSASEA